MFSFHCSHFCSLSPPRLFESFQSRVPEIFAPLDILIQHAIVPNHLLGRVISIASVLAWSAIPLGSFLGGLAIEWTKNVVLVYAVSGTLVFLIPLVFSFTALGHADRYLPKQEEPLSQNVTSEGVEA